MTLLRKVDVDAATSKKNNDASASKDKVKTITSLLSSSTLNDDSEDSNNEDDTSTSNPSSKEQEVEVEDPPSSSTTTTILVYTHEELTAMREVQRLLQEKHGMGPDTIGLKYIALVTMIAKNRPEETCEKILKFFKALATVGIHSLTDEDLSIRHKSSPLDDYLKVYHLCGVDTLGRDSMWIYADEHSIKYNTEDEQQCAVWAGILYHFAIHANPHTLRQGLGIFCIDTSHQPASTNKAAEAKMQKINQSYPMRPQTILIAGASKTKRIIINAIITVASLFTKEKILKRIKFVSVAQAMEQYPTKGYPQYLPGGQGRQGGEEGDEPMNVMEWTQQRIDSFPVPQL
jgi:hypothetical protein